VSARRGERRIRVTLEVGPRSAHVKSLEPLEGPAVQRPALEGTHVAQVMLGGATVLLQAFEDPLLVRGIAPRGKIGHSFSRIDRGIVTVDVPLPEGELPGEITIKVADLSKLKRRPTDPEGLQALLDDPPRAVRTVADVGEAELVRHPEWATLGLPGTPPIPPTGSFEIYVDRARRYRWRLRKPDGHIVADSSQGYRSREECEADLRWLREHGTTAPVRSDDLD
jgi:uncharacterized protein YegP (UPF0339 family)